MSIQDLMLIILGAGDYWEGKRNLYNLGGQYTVSQGDNRRKTKSRVFTILRLE